MRNLRNIIERRAGLDRLKRFARDSRGAAAIEFAFVAGPFLFMVFALMELALVFLLSTSLDTASDQASRRIRTGEFQTANQTGTQFRTQVCQRMTWLANDCENRLFVDVRTYTDFNSINDPLLTNSTSSPGKKVFNQGGVQFTQRPAPSTIVVVRSYYRWGLVSPFMNQGLARLEGSNNTALITAVQAFRTEPYQL
jgi:Flp pilus assembly protein TadG